MKKIIKITLLLIICTPLTINAACLYTEIDALKEEANNIKIDINFIDNKETNDYYVVKSTPFKNDININIVNISTNKSFSLYSEKDLALKEGGLYKVDFTSLNCETTLRSFSTYLPVINISSDKENNADISVNPVILLLIILIVLTLIIITIITIKRKRRKAYEV